MEETRFYVYVYLDQRKPGKWIYKDKEFEYQPFYVGKGTRKRDVVHLLPSMLNQKTHKTSTIKAIIQDTGQLPIHYRIYDNISQEDATNIEIEFIKIFGRKDINSGILCNHTDGEDGSHNLPLESRRRIGEANRKKVFQYSMGGYFIKEWNSLSEIGNVINITQANISTAIKRGGSCGGFLWAYEYLGEKIDGKIKYQMPIKYKNIKQISIQTGEIIKIHSDALRASEDLHLTNENARCKIIDCVNGKLKTAYGYKWSL